MIDRLRAAGREASGRQLAEAFGWTASGRECQLSEQDLGGIHATKAFFRGEPALLVVNRPDLVEVDGADSILDSAAFVGYHAAIDWGIVSSRQGLTVFHSRWVRNRNWYRLPRLSWSDLESGEPLLSALTPSGITEGALQRIATTQYYTADSYLRPLDEELVARLDNWRRNALAIAPRTEGVDEALQVLFAQFFVLRTVEDRDLAPGLNALSTIVQDGRVDRSALGALFAEASRRIQPDLFAAPVGDLIRDEIVAGVVKDLYEPRHLPVNTSYNFSWLDADVLGRAYEKYLSRVLEPLPPDDQSELFGPVRRVAERDVRHQEGVYYTPSYLARALVAQAIDPMIDRIEGSGALAVPTPIGLIEPVTELAIGSQASSRASNEGGSEVLPIVADFACGSGGFLVAAADHLLRRLRAVDPNRQWAHELVRGRHLVGVDKDPRAITLTRLNLYIRLTAEPEALPLPSLDESIVVGDSLGIEVWDGLPSAYDVVLGNPPFVATESQVSREELVGRFTSAQGRFDVAYLFIELAIQKLRPNGVMSLVVPNRLFRNRDAGPIREVLTAQTDLLCLIDFGSQSVFKGIGAYVGTITAVKRPAPTQAGPVKVVTVLTVDEIDFLGPLLVRAAETAADFRNDVLEKFDIPHPQGAEPWLLVPPAVRIRRISLSTRSVRLSEIALTPQGIRTGANDIFIMVVDSSANGLARVTNAAGESGTVELELLRPVIFGSEIQRYDEVHPTKHLLYPYRHGIAVGEDELRHRLPQAWSYLQRYHDALAARGSLSSSGAKWYELVRKRDEAWLTSPKLMIRDLITDAAFAIDEAGSTFLVGGTAIVPLDTSLLWALLGYLNSTTVTEHLRQLTPAFRGGFQKVEPRHLESIPVPQRLIHDREFAGKIAHLARSAVQSRVDARRGPTSAATLRIDSLVQEVLDMPLEDYEGEGSTSGDENNFDL